jgi:hypothetical protein
MSSHNSPAHVPAAAPGSHAASQVSEAKRTANAANAQLSTGPTSPEGKVKSSLNAVKTGLTGRTVLLPTDDAAAYQHHIAEFEKEFQPVGARECALVQSVADTFWRLDRIPALEFAIYAKGRTEFAGQFEHEDPSARPTLIDLHTHLAYEKQIRNLQIQEARLHRRREKDLAELRDLQQERKKREAAALETAAQLYLAAKHDNRAFNPEDHGFEFSTAQIEAYVARRRASQIARAALKADHAHPQKASQAA